MSTRSLLIFALTAALCDAWAPRGNFIRTDLPDGVVSIPLRRIKDQMAYGVDFWVGNPPQPATLLADTGSNLISFESSIDDVCKRGYCKDFGYYDNKTSSTSKWVAGGFTNGVNNNGYGSIVNDTLRVSGQQFPNMQFGVTEGHHASFPLNNQLAAILGLGTRCSTRQCDEQLTFIQQMYNNGYIGKRAFSVYLGPNEPDAVGNLLLGGIDLAKRKGKLYKLNMIDPLDNRVFGMPNNVGVRGYTLETRQLPAQNFPAANCSSFSLLDSGSPRLYVPKDVFDGIVKYFRLPSTIDSNDTHYEIDCIWRKIQDAKLTVSFDSANMTIPLHTLPTKVGNKCFLDIGPWDGVLGDPFLRSVYVTFNYEDFTVEISQVQYTNHTNIVRI